MNLTNDTYDKFGVNTKNSFNTPPKENIMKTYKLKIQETIEYDCTIDANGIKDAELKALQHPEKWQEIQGVLDVLDIEQAD